MPLKVKVNLSAVIAALAPGFLYRESTSWLRAPSGLRRVPCVVLLGLLVSPIVSADEPCRDVEQTGPLTDPVLLGQQGIALSYSYDGSKSKNALRTLHVAAASETDAHPLDVSQFGDTVDLSGTQLIVSSGDLDGDGQDELVEIQTNPPQVRCVSFDTEDHGTLGSDPCSRDYDLGSHFPSRVTTGDVDGDGRDEIVIAGYVSGNPDDPLIPMLMVLDSKSFSIAASAAVSQEALIGLMDVKTADFDQDERDEIALAWPLAVTDDDAISAPTRVQIFEVIGAEGSQSLWAAAGEGGPEIALPLATLGAIYSGPLKLTTGDFEGNGIQRLLLALPAGPKSDAKPVLQMFGVSRDLSKLSPYGAQVFDISGPNSQNVVPVAADFDLDGTDEIAIAYGNKGSSHPFDTRLALVTWSPSANVYSARFDQKVSSTDGNALAGTASQTLDAVVADVNRDGLPEVVYSWLGGSHASLQVFSVAGDLSSATPGEKLSYSIDEPVTLSMADGDFQGQSVRVGNPCYVRRDDVLQLVAILNVPPTHQVSAAIVPPGGLNINNNEDTFVSFSQSVTQNNDIRVQVRSDWGFSTTATAKLGGSLGKIETSLTAAYGEGFSKTSARSFSKTESQDIDAILDDTILVTEMDYDVWQYELFDGPDEESDGHMLVVLPVDAGSTIKHGLDPLSYYTPDHELANVLSYSTSPPRDFSASTQLTAPHTDNLGGSNDGFTITYEDMKSNDRETSQKLDLSVSAKASTEGSFLGAVEWGLGLETSATYSKDSISTHTVSFGTATDLEVQFAAIDPRYTYRVTSYPYWSSDDGHLEIDYAVEVPSRLTSPGIPPTWWDDTYTAADLSFNLPWRFQTGSAYVEYTREITFDPPSSSSPANQQIVVQASIHNYSILSAEQPFTVTFYDGDPESGGTKIGTPQSVAGLPARGSARVSVTWAVPDDAPHDIYAVIDPGTNPDLSGDNNRAYGVWPGSTSTGQALTARVH